MIRRLLLLALCAGLAVGGARADDSVAVLAVADAPAGPDGQLAELARELGAACRERSRAVLDPRELRARLAGQPPPARLAELERTAAAAVLQYQSGDYARSVRTWRGVVEELERLQDGPESYEPWTRAVLRLAHAEGTLRHWAEARAAMAKLLAVEPRFAPDPDEYSPSYRRLFDEVRQKLRGRPPRRLTITSGGRSGAAFVNGKAVGATPVTVTLPAGRYRVGGSSEGLRSPPEEVDLGSGDRSVALDFALAESVRLDAGPGLAASEGGRVEILRRVAPALGVARLLLVTRVEGDAQLDGALYDVGQRAVVRQGRVPLSGGRAPPAAIEALAIHLLTGQHLPRVREVIPAPAPLVRAAAGSDATAPSVTAPLQVPAPEPAPDGKRTAPAPGGPDFKDSE